MAESQHSGNTSPLERQYKCPVEYCIYLGDTQKSVAGHVLSEHNINLFKELSIINLQSYLESISHYMYSKS